MSMATPPGSCNGACATFGRRIDAGPAFGVGMPRLAGPVLRVGRTAGNGRFSLTPENTVEAGHEAKPATVANALPACRPDSA